MNLFITLLKWTTHKIFLVCIALIVVLFFTTKTSNAQVIKNITKLDTTDFLNSYFIKPSFSSNSLNFRLKLGKVIIGKQYDEKGLYIQNDKKSKYYHIISNEINNTNGDETTIPEFVAYLPEIIDVSEVEFYSSIPNKALDNEFTFLDISEPSSVDSLNYNIPTFNVVKNKLLTIEYKNKEEESFVITTKYDTTNLNNGKVTLSVSLANENISDKNKNILWRFFEIENNIYLALSSDQLTRLGLRLIPYESFSLINDSREFVKYEDVIHLHGSPLSSNGLYLLRKNSYGKYQLDPQNLIYLFKIEIIK